MLRTGPGIQPASTTDANSANPLLLMLSAHLIKSSIKPLVGNSVPLAFYTLCLFAGS